MEKKNDRPLSAAEIVDIIESVIPPQLQESWDNSGSQIIFGEKDVRKILLSIDIDERVIKESDDIGTDMIITHHPMLFNGIKSIDADTPKGKLLYHLFKRELSVYSCHTSFDKIKGGNNDRIAELLGLGSIKNLAGDPVDSPQKMIENRTEADIGRIGRLKEGLTVKQMIERISSALEMSLRQIRVAGDMDRIVKTIGICTGAGADLMETARESGCNMFITGDVKYHEAQMADELDICLIDAGHYHTEKFFGKAFCDMVQKKLGDKVEICLSKVDFAPFIML